MTVINNQIDANWKTILETPPFPEYTSGHSVVSGAAATALTSIFGEDFSFEDDTETPYGLPIRKFNSFNEAADEAAISRMYGGIHYRAAVEVGVGQGRKIGALLNSKIEMKKNRTSGEGADETSKAAQPSHKRRRKGAKGAEPGARSRERIDRQRLQFSKP